MSFISVIVKKDFITVMCDGRGTRLLNDGQYDFGNISEENAQKFITVGNDFFVAFTGTKEDAEHFIEVANLNKHRAGSLSTLAKEAHALFLSKYYMYDISIVLGGKNKYGKMQAYGFDNKSTELDVMIPDSENYRYCFLGAKMVNEADTKNKFVQLCSEKNPLTIEDYLDVQKRLNEFIASKDITVNNNTRTLIIK